MLQPPRQMQRRFSLDEAPPEGLLSASPRATSALSASLSALGLGRGFVDAGPSRESADVAAVAEAIEAAEERLAGAKEEQDGREKEAEDEIAGAAAAAHKSGNWAAFARAVRRHAPDATAASLLRVRQPQGPPTPRSPAPRPLPQPERDPARARRASCLPAATSSAARRVAETLERRRGCPPRPWPPALPIPRSSPPLSDSPCAAARERQGRSVPRLRAGPAQPADGGAAPSRQPVRATRGRERARARRSGLRARANVAAARRTRPPRPTRPPGPRRYERPVNVRECTAQHSAFRAALRANGVKVLTVREVLLHDTDTSVRARVELEDLAARTAAGGRVGRVGLGAAAAAPHTARARAAASLARPPLLSHAVRRSPQAGRLRYELDDKARAHALGWAGSNKLRCSSQFPF